jgi:hypothetical protein
MDEKKVVISAQPIARFYVGFQQVIPLEVYEQERQDQYGPTGQKIRRAIVTDPNTGEVFHVNGDKLIIEPIRLLEGSLRAREDVLIAAVMSGKGNPEILAELAEIRTKLQRHDL